jgi:hypothetical protein
LRVIARELLLPERDRRLLGVWAVAAIYLRPFEFGPIGSGAAIVLEGSAAG